MSLAQTYSLAAKAKSKLTKEAVNPNADLRYLVCQANLLDNLMDSITHRRPVSILEPEPVAARKESDLHVRFDNTTKVTTTEISGDLDDLDDDDYYYDSEDSYVSDDDDNYGEFDSDDSDSDSDSDSEESLVFSARLGSVEFTSRPLTALESEQLPQLSHSSSESDSEDEHERNISSEKEYRFEPSVTSSKDTLMPNFHELVVF
ncbi:unnamed protein product [Kuraishia capsulata CBS 1993]|uniref:Uncharacterized protein n=1 Tax=Kuraishia capsulata CBS 1993 TaxID=1382522 RepID=W6MJC8_9ASCO|nr:uncharacterized protein KUCA_T00002343001 [Kuraishia capsulata CBS 1993]CDK26371.1 unnamed protein product [Kuraishia capsulata CBS 1993]